MPRAPGTVCTTSGCAGAFRRSRSSSPRATARRSCYRMRLPASSERTPGADTRAASALAWLALAVLAACSSGPKRPVMHPAKPITREGPAPAAAPAGAPAAGSATSTAPPVAAPSVAPAPAPHAATAAPARGTANPTAPAPAHPQVSPAARADFDRLVGYMRAGKAVEAQLGFKQLSLQYPQFE